MALACALRVPLAGTCVRGRRSFGGRRWEFGAEIRNLRYPQEHLEFFSNHCNFIQPPDICLLLEGLVKTQPRSDNLGSKELFNSVEFMKMMKIVVRMLEKFGPRELPRLLVSLQSIQWTDKQLFKIAEPIAIRHVPSFTLRELSQVTSSYVSLQVGGRSLFDEIVHRCSQDEDVDTEVLADLAHAFSTSPHKPKAFLSGVCNLVVQRFRGCSPQQLVRIVSAYSEKARDVPPQFFSELLSILLESDGRLLQNLAAPELATLLRGVVLLSKRQGKWSRTKAVVVLRLGTDALSKHIAAGKVDSTEAAMMLWAYTKLPAMTPGLFEALHDCLIHRVDRLPNSWLGTGLLATARCVSSMSDGTGHNWDTRLFDAAEKRVQLVIDNLEVRQLTMVVVAYTIARTGSRELISVLQRACIERHQEFPMEQAASIVWSFATLRLSLEFFDSVQFEILENMNQLSIPAICDVLWAYCVVRIYEPQFIKALLKFLMPSRLAGDARCALLCPALLDIRSKFPDMDPEGLQRYIGYVEDVFHRSQVENAPPRHVVEAMSAALASQGHLSKSLVNVDGYVVDIVVEGLLPVAVLYHSQQTLHQTTREPLGHTMMRQRHLKRRFAVINVPGDTWETLDEDARAAFLAAKLAQAAVRKKHDTEKLSSATRSDKTV